MLLSVPIELSVRNSVGHYVKHVEGITYMYYGSLLIHSNSSGMQQSRNLEQWHAVIRISRAKEGIKS